MATDTEQERQPENIPRRRPSSSGGPLVTLALLLTLVFALADWRESHASDRHASGNDTFRESAFFGGVERRYTHSNFRGGEAEALFGGVDLDLRDATIEGDEATLHVSAAFGGVNIKVPKDWVVVNRVTALFGGVSDKTRAEDGNKRLIIDGDVLMGGLDIRN